MGEDRRTWLRAAFADGRRVRACTVAALALAIAGGGPSSTHAAQPTISSSVVGSGDATVAVGGTAGHGAIAWLERSGSRNSLHAATVARGRIAGRSVVTTSTARSGALAVIALGVDRRHTQRLLFGRRRGHELALFVSERHGNGRWSSPHALGTAAIGGLIGTRVEASLSTSPSGSSVAVWCRGGQSDNALDTKHPGTIFTAHAGPGGRWSRPRRLWKGQFCSATTVTFGANGRALASWFGQPIELDDAPRYAAVGTAGGRWQRPHLLQMPDQALGPTTHVTAASDGGLLLATSPLSTDAGDIVELASASPAGRLTGTATIETPSPSATADGWIGAGPPVRVTAAHGTAAQATVLVANGPAGRADGGADLTALWAATRAGSAATLVPVDDLAIASAPTADDQTWSVDLDEGSDGRLTATWAAFAGSECDLAIYQSTRGADGRWPRRVLVGTRTFGHRTCDVMSLDATPAAGLVVTATGRATQVTPTPAAAGGSAPTPTVTLRTPTWSAARAAGALEFTCAIAGGGICHISLVPALRDPARFEALEGNCRPSVAAAKIPAAGTGVVRFPLSSECYAGGTAAAPSTQTVDVPFVAAADRLGLASTRLDSTVQVTP